MGKKKKNKERKKKKRKKYYKSSMIQPGKAGWSPLSPALEADTLPLGHQGGGNNLTENTQVLSWNSLSVWMLWKHPHCL